MPQRSLAGNGLTAWINILAIVHGNLRLFIKEN
ncbi:MAG: hypothetical protein RugAbin2_00394 [Rugosibacter sp.]|jgi:hypothetical protein|nr:hypothetical protein [Rugosibacter sp.]